MNTLNTLLIKHAIMINEFVMLTFMMLPFIVIAPLPAMVVIAFETLTKKYEIDS